MFNTPKVRVDVGIPEITFSLQQFMDKWNKDNEAQVSAMVEQALCPAVLEPLIAEAIREAVQRKVKEEINRAVNYNSSIAKLVRARVDDVMTETQAKMDEYDARIRRMIEEDAEKPNL